ncbi:MAG: tetraacyldisaccharide 4'-kinase [Acidobacteriota bacterium]
MNIPLESPPVPRSPWQWVYGQAHRARRRWYQNRAKALPRPVVSVGNLHWGGSGKTPFAAAVAAHLRDAGLAVAILSRGYGSRGEGVRIVSRGQGPLLGPRIAGDEPVHLAGMLPGVSVVVCGDRHRAGVHALERLDPAPQVFVLDDGFSHLRLARDLDILVFPAEDPFAGGKLAPGGRLREPLASTSRADAVVLAGAEVAEEGGLQLARSLRRHGFAGQGFVSRTVADAPRSVGPGGEVDPGGSVLVVCAIARPERFFVSVRRAGLDIADHLTFADHHRYPEASLAKITAAFQATGAAAVVTTGKDAVKLRGRLDIPVIEIPVRARLESGFEHWLDERLRRLGVDIPEPG